MYYKYKPKKATNIVYYSLLFVALILMIMRWVSAFNNSIVVINEEINSHISNFSLSLLFYLVIGFTWILQGVSFKKTAILGTIMVIGNILCETFMGFMNTPDIIDALYGTAGTIISFCFLLGANKYGINIIAERK